MGMALTNAEKQRRWRDRRNELAQALTGSPKEIPEAIFRELGVDQSKKVVRALDKRLRNLKPDCPASGGTASARVQTFTACGTPMSAARIPCDCGPGMQAMQTADEVRSESLPAVV